ncbi:probable protein phosphatase 2C 34 [Solanum stenotomum]|uniref:probable protein phosphatase 2C 34 n=1 Tax=Solanum stenotomum TaxID=172797 RepID=UPI0020D1D73D|nr:probable protein phosphatase 2C 34 [Solanum stenotomum]
MAAARLYAAEKAAKDIYLKRAKGPDYTLTENGRKSDHFHDQYIFFLPVWDVISNEETVEIVSEIPNRAKTALHIVQCVVRAWKCKRRGIVVDDISAIKAQVSVSHVLHLPAAFG